MALEGGYQELARIVHPASDDLRGDPRRGARGRRLGHTRPVDQRLAGRATFHYDLGSPYAYLAAERIHRVFDDAGAEAPEWQPILLGGLFKRFGRDSWANGPGRERACARSSAALRPTACPRSAGPSRSRATPCSRCGSRRSRARSGAASRCPLAAFRQAFAAGRDLTDPDNVFIAAASAELHPRALRAAAERDSIKARLRAATEAAATSASWEFPACSWAARSSGATTGLRRPLPRPPPPRSVSSKRCPETVARVPQRDRDRPRHGRAGRTEQGPARRRRAGSPSRRPPRPTSTWRRTSGSDAAASSESFTRAPWLWGVPASERRVPRRGVRDVLPRQRRRRPRLPRSSGGATIFDADRKDVAEIGAELERLADQPRRRADVAGARRRDLHRGTAAIGASARWPRFSTRAKRRRSRAGGHRPGAGRGRRGGSRARPHRDAVVRRAHGPAPGRPPGSSTGCASCWRTPDSQPQGKGRTRPCRASIIDVPIESLPFVDEHHRDRGNRRAGLGCADQRRSRTHRGRSARPCPARSDAPRPRRRASRARSARRSPAS